MRIIPLVTGLAAALLAGAAVAQSPAPATFPVIAAAPNVCAVSQVSIESGALVNFRNQNGSTFFIDRLVDPVTLSTSAASAQVTFDAVCNLPHRLVVESQNNGLWREAVGLRPPSGFADGVPYTASVQWGALSRRFNVDADGRRIRSFEADVGVPTIGELEMRIDIQAGATNGAANEPLVAGVYQDTIRVTLEPL